MKKRLIIVFLILLLATAATELFLPIYYENKIKKSFQGETHGYDYLEVDVDTDPAILLLLGRVKYGFVKAIGLELEEIRVESIESLYKNLRLINTSTGLKAVEGENSSFKAVLLEKDLNNYIKGRYDQFQDLKLNLSPTGASLDLKEEFFGRLVEVTLTGDFEFTDERTVSFTPKDLKVQDIEVPKLLLSKLIKAVEFELDLEELPLPLDLDEIDIEEDKLIIKGGE